MHAIGRRGSRAHLLGEAFRIVCQDGLQVLEIALVAHQHHHNRRVGMRAELLEPPLDVLCGNGNARVCRVGEGFDGQRGAWRIVAVGPWSWSSTRSSAPNVSRLEMS